MKLNIISTEDKLNYGQGIMLKFKTTYAQVILAFNVPIIELGLNIDCSNDKDVMEYLMLTGEENFQ